MVLGKKFKKQDGIEANQNDKDETSQGHRKKRLSTYLHNRSIKSAFALYTTIATVIAILASVGAYWFLSELRDLVEADTYSGLYIFDKENNSLVDAEAVGSSDNPAFYAETFGSDNTIDLSSANNAELLVVDYSYYTVAGAEVAYSFSELPPISLEELPSYDAEKQSEIDETMLVEITPTFPGQKIPIISQVAYYVDSTADPDLKGIISLLSILVIPLVFVLIFVITGRLFYRNHLAGPVKTMDDAAARIAKNDLDFTIPKTSENELGRLSDSFELMRASLEKNNKEMWRAADNRKQVNAAFAHDLRTPLTVLKGSTELLRCLFDVENPDYEAIKKTTTSMARQIDRLEQYVHTMYDLSQLEDLVVVPSEISTQEFSDQLSTISEAMSATAEITLMIRAKNLPKMLFFDEKAVMQVIENLLDNAVRFSESKITLSLEVVSDKLSVAVIDDGPGFSSVALQTGCDAYFSEKSSNTTDERAKHFGLGLNICSNLCKKHGGHLLLSNTETGGACVIATFSLTYGKLN